MKFKFESAYGNIAAKEIKVISSWVLRREGWEEGPGLLEKSASLLTGLEIHSWLRRSK
jgi:hypothetical protein